MDLFPDSSGLATTSRLEMFATKTATKIRFANVSALFVLLSVLSRKYMHTSEGNTERKQLLGYGFRLRGTQVGLPIGDVLLTSPQREFQTASSQKSAEKIEERVRDCNNAILIRTQLIQTGRLLLVKDCFIFYFMLRECHVTTENAVKC